MNKDSVFLILLGLSLPALPEEAPGLSERALALVRDVRAHRMGVDQEDHLWTWDHATGRIELYAPSGESVATARLGSAVDLAVDRRWGVAGIVADGRELRLVPFGGGSSTSIRLPDQVGGVAWIDADTVAVAPSFADHRAQLWQVREKKLLRKLGTEFEIVPKIGTTVLRDVDLQYDPGRKLLYSLETFYGDLKVFALDGRLVLHETFPPVERREMDEWLAQTDRDMKEKNEVFTPGIRWFSLAVGSDGSAWSVLACDPKKASATFLQIPVPGKSRSVALDSTCCSHPLVIWKGWLATYSDPTKPRCNLVRRAPCVRPLRFAPCLQLLLQRNHLHAEL
jgi:hypothetical protein